MKKYLVVSLLVILGCNSDKKFATEITGFKLPNDASRIERYKNFNNDPSGDGEQLAAFSFSAKDSIELVEKCKGLGYLSLPINENNLTDGTIFKYVGRNDTLGFYKLNIDPKSKLSYSIAVVNFKDHKIVTYRVFY